MDDHIPGEKPLEIEMAFGDPDALEKAMANIEIYPYCTIYDLHCPWVDRCNNDQFWNCPIEIDERNRVNEKQAHRHP